MSDWVSTTELTTDSAWVAGLAILALIAAGWRKPARAAMVPARATRNRRQPPPIELFESATEMHQRTPLWRRVVAVFASSAIAIVTGAVIATIVAAGLAFGVVRLTDMLRR
jgi:ABC-type nitrate/sulfonate/bicarbonate transport system permease component